MIVPEEAFTGDAPDTLCLEYASGEDARAVPDNNDVRTDAWRNDARDGATVAGAGARRRVLHAAADGRRGALELVSGVGAGSVNGLFSRWKE